MEYKEKKYICKFLLKLKYYIILYLMFFYSALFILIIFKDLTIMIKVRNINKNEKKIIIQIYNNKILYY